MKIENLSLSRVSLMAASHITVSTLPSSPPRLLLPRRPAGTFGLSTSTFLSSFQTLRAPSDITRHLHRRHPLPGELAVVRAGPPSASTLILVFVLPSPSSSAPSWFLSESATSSMRNSSKR
ncbi:hypothetical protein KFK09_007444 [Dendrobium nobile]|uniref:Uncharacterized protein n=1 Tax=Dendrobium nobile TaxID=94219 RepID=A0A8T3BUD2_DENNO|nr:hypothetical protein KFK09_007444 [Dendrobium nobile]